MIGPQFLAAPLGTPGFPRTAAYVSRAQRRALRAISGKRTTIPRACAGVCTVSIRWAEKGDAISTLSPMPQGPPRTCLRATICWAQVARELCENTLPIALAVSFAGERAIKHRPDTEHEHDGPDR
jgi:hypothetical protein